MRSAKRTWWRPGGKRRLRVTTDGHEHVADAARCELEGGAEVLDLDDRLDRDARLLGARVICRRVGSSAAWLASVRISGLRASSRRRHGTAHAVRMRARVEHLVAQRRLHDEAFGVDRQHDQAGLEPPRAHVVGDGRGVEADDAQAHARVAVGEGLGEVGQQVVDGGRERAEAGRAGAHVAHARDRLARRLDLGEHALGVGQQRAPRLGRLDAAPDAHEQRHAQLALEPADLLRERWLGQVQRLGGRAEGALLEGLAEVGELLEIHVLITIGCYLLIIESGQDRTTVTRAYSEVVGPGPTQAMTVVARESTPPSRGVGHAEPPDLPASAARRRRSPQRGTPPAAPPRR